jgi:hypothetical protein
MPKGFTRASHLDSFHLAHTKFLDSKKESRYKHKHHDLYSYGTVSHSYQLVVGTLPKSRFPYPMPAV